MNQPPTSGSRLGIALKEAPVPIAVLRGANYVVEVINRAMCEILGRGEGQLLGRALFEALPEARADGLEDLLDLVRSTRNRYSGVERPVRFGFDPNGPIRLFDVLYEPLADGDGSVESILVVATDVTDKVLARQRIEAARMAEQRAQDRMHRLAAVTLELARQPTLDDIVAVITQEARKLIGVEQASIRLVDASEAVEIAAVSRSGVYPQMLRPVPVPVPGDALLVRLMEQVSRPIRLSEEALRPEPRMLELAALAGLQPPVRGLLAVPLRGPKGDLLGVVALSCRLGGDFTEEDESVMTQLVQYASAAIDNARLFELARQERARAEEANRTKDEFLAAVSHELRNPLNAILGWAQLLQTSELPPAKCEHGLEVIHRNARAQARLIEDLLDVSRMVSGRILLERERLDPWTSASAVVEAVVPAARTKGIELTLRGEPGKHVINADPSRIRQIVSNLVENAIKFTPAGGRIDVVVEAFEQGICIRVCDDGAGLEPAELERVFDRFYQAKRRSSVGLGLGLTIVRHLAELHGGRVEVQSEGLGCGASVSVWLPKSRPTNDVPAVQPRLDPAVQLLAGVRVLVVEDEPDARELLEHVLTLSGAHTVLVEEGRQALELLSRESFDVLLSDIAMPGMDGYELIRRLRASSDDRLRRMPSVALTAYAASRDRRRAMVEGFDVHLSKPIVSDELVRSVASIVGRRQAVSSPD